MHRVVVWLLLALLPLTVAACRDGSDARPESGQKLLTYDEMVREYREKVSGYPDPLPSGVRFPDRPRPPEQDTLYEKGEGVVTADAFWICAWTGEWLKSRRTDTPRADAAMGWLDKAAETEFMTNHYHDPDNIWGEEILGKAKLGDITNLSDYYANGCAHREGLGPVA
jgi:hypothetical protein